MNTFMVMVRNLFVIVARLKKYVSIFIFKTAPDNLFYTSKNIKIKEVLFIYPDQTLNNTNKFKWLYDSELFFSDLKKIYIDMSPDNIIIDDNIGNCFIRLKSKNDTIIIDMFDDTYVDTNIGKCANDVIFDIIPIFPMF